jgi:APA family basic amino acid/polyamine antiporter
MANEDLPRRIGVWGGSAIMVGLMIGSGIFRTPASIAQEMGNPLLILLLWLAGGMLSLFGALTYAELATLFPHAGGLYVFLQRGLGNRVAFTFGWTYMLLVQPLAIASIATVFAEHLNGLLGNRLDVRAITCAVAILLTAVNVTGIRRGAGIAVILTGLKVIALALIVGVALALTKGNVSHFTPTEAPKPLLVALTPVLAAILWTYDGWSDAAALAGEIKEPQKQLPRMFLLGTTLVIALYVAVNAVYIWIIPLSAMRETATVAPLVMEHLLGSAGRHTVTVMILISTLGAAHGSIIVGARVTYAQARDRLLFAGLGRIHPTYQTPYVALWVQAALSCVMVIWLERFERMIGGFVFTIWIFYGLAAVAVIVVRVRRPDLPRPYRCWGYPVVPLVFILSAAAVTVLAIIDSPKDTIPWLGILLAGVPAYWLWQVRPGRK